MTTTPRYRAFVSNQSRGWAYQSTHGDVPTGTEAVLLADGLDFTYGFDGEQIPGQLVPTEATFSLWAKSAAQLPTCEKGDRVNVSARLMSPGPAVGPYFLAPASMRVAAATASLSSNKRYPAKLTVRLIDANAELPAITPVQGMVGLQGITGWNFASPRWRVRFAELAARLAQTIACPTWWGDDERPAETTRPNPAGNLLRGLDQPELVDTGARYGTSPIYRYAYGALEVLHRLLNAHHPANISHVIVPGWSDSPSSFPAGWRRVGPDNYWYPYNDGQAITGGPIPAFTEPQTSARYYLVPASRTVAGSSSGGPYLPMVFAVVGGQLTLRPNPTATSPVGHRPLALDAAWCDLPADFRKAREHAVNVLELEGQESYQSAAGAAVVLRNGTRVYSDPVAQLADGTVSRKVPTALDLGTAAADYHADADRFTSAEGNYIQTNYLADASQRSSWSPDEFTVRLSRIPADVAPTLVPRILPRQPGELDGDDQQLRHVTVYRLPDDKRFSDAQPVTGFVTKGRMTIAGGDVVFKVTLTPGMPRYASGATPAPITVGQVDAASYQGQALSTIDPRIRVADLAYVAS